MGSSVVTDVRLLASLLILSGKELADPIALSSDGLFLF